MSDPAFVMFVTCLLLAACCVVCALLISSVLRERVHNIQYGAFCDLLDYASVMDESVIALKNGALMRIYELFPQDLSHEDDAQLEHLRELTSRALLKLGGQWCFQVDAVRSPDENYLPVMQSDNDTCIELDMLRRRTFMQDKSFKTRFYLTLTYIGESKARHALVELMIEADKCQNNDMLKRTLTLVDNFKARTDSVAETLALTLKLKLLKLNPETNEHEALSFIHECITGKQIHLVYPHVPSYLDVMLATEDFATGLTPMIGKKFIAAVAVDGLPSESYFGVLNELSQLPCACRFHTRFLCFDDLQSAFLLEKYRRFWKQKTKGILAQVFNLNGRINANAAQKVEEIDAAKAQLDAHEEIFGAYTAVVILMHEDFEVLQEYADLVVKKLEDLGFGARIETVNSVEAYLGSLPGQFKENLRRPLVSQAVLTDFLPLSMPWEGEREAPNPFLGKEAGPLMQVRTAGKGRFYLNLHEKDLGNTIIIGPPGAGKSVLLQALTANFLRYKNARVFAFDKGWSFYALTKAMGGEHIVLENVQSALCPLEDIDTGANLEYGLTFCELLCRMSGVQISAAQRLEFTQNLQLLKERPRNERTLSDLYLLLSDNELKDAIAPYTLLGNAKAILDHSTNLSFDTVLTTFECGNIFENSQRFSLPLLKQLFHLIERSFDGRPVMLVLDEAWMMLRDPVFAAELLKWFKTLRKHNVCVVLATQSLTDIANSSLFEVFLECAKTRIFLPNFDAGSAVLRPIYQKMGLNESELQSIIHGLPKQDYLLHKGPHSVLFSLDLSAEEVKLYSFAGDHCVPQVDAQIAAHGEQFFSPDNLRAEFKAGCLTGSGGRYVKLRELSDWYEVTTLGCELPEHDGGGSFERSGHPEDFEEEEYCNETGSMENLAAAVDESHVRAAAGSSEAASAAGGAAGADAPQLAAAPLQEDDKPGLLARLKQRLTAILHRRREPRHEYTLEGHLKQIEEEEHVIIPRKRPEGVSEYEAKAMAASLAAQRLAEREEHERVLQQYCGLSLEEEMAEQQERWERMFPSPQPQPEPRSARNPRQEEAVGACCAQNFGLAPLLEPEDDPYSDPDFDPDSWYAPAESDPMPYIASNEEYQFSDNALPDLNQQEERDDEKSA